jgi:hypothetical protein
MTKGSLQNAAHPCSWVLEHLLALWGQAPQLAEGRHMVFYMEVEINGNPLTLEPPGRCY